VDPTLRARLRAGEPEAFAELFDEYARVVYQHGYRLTGQRALAEDVVSATFLEAWRIHQRIEPDRGALRPWLLGIATNVVRNLRRKARREGNVLARLSPQRQVPDFADEVAGLVDAAAELAVVRHGMQSLTPGEVEVIALFAWAGLDYAETAQALGIPVGTVRSRLFRARQKLARPTPARPATEPDPGCGQIRGGRPDLVRPARKGN
jgi:RNA polymerase sigma-70 factor (ECF subfamily)